MAVPLAGTAPLPLLIDAHAHLHDAFDTRRFLDGAAANFREAARGLGLDGTTGCLLLADCAGARGFERLRHESVADWTLRPTRDGLGIRASHERLGDLLIMAGSQLRTAERLEVLGLLTDAAIPDGLPLEAAIERVVATDGVAVVPWGFGKWTFGRRRRVAQVLDRPDLRFLLGDNGGRLHLTAPGIFAEASRRGVPVVPGSDPLPFPDHEQRAGSSGFVVEATLREDAPAASLRALLTELRGQPRVFGAGRPLLRFVRDQLRMQLRRLRR